MRTERDGGEAPRGRRARKGKVTSCSLPLSAGSLARFFLPLSLPSFRPLSPLSAVSVGLGSFGPKKLKKQEKTAQERFGPEFRRRRPLRSVRALQFLLTTMRPDGSECPNVGRPTHWPRSLLQRSTHWFGRGCKMFVVAVPQLFCLALTKVVLV